MRVKDQSRTRLEGDLNRNLKKEKMQPNQSHHILETIRKKIYKNCSRIRNDTTALSETIFRLISIYYLMILLTQHIMK